MSKQFPVLYKYTSKNQVQRWQIVVEGNSFYTIEGIDGGKLTQSLPTYCNGKNIGRANETSPEQQAYNEAASKHQKKLDSNYNEVLTKDVKFFSPMLAKSISDVSQDELKNLIKTGLYIQPKLDGLRAISANNSLTSRNGKFFVSTPHLHQDQYILDGELYTHVYNDDFDEIISLCKKQKVSSADLERTKIIEYHVYDFPEHTGVFMERYEAMLKALDTINNKSIIPVITYKISTLDEIEEYHSKFLEDGYEGSIIRTNTSAYESGKRSKQCLKYKDFLEREFEVVEILEGIGNRDGTAGKVICKLDDGRTFGAGIKGGFKYFEQLLKDKDKYIGKTATVKYFRETPNGIPRFPVITKMARETYE